MKNKEMKNLFLSPTPKPSRLSINTCFDNILELCDEIDVPKIKQDGCIQDYNIYITNDEEIIGGKEWFLDLTDNSLFKNKVDVPMSKVLFPNCKKIILTTDPDLIKDGVQSIPDEFLEWFVKNPSCEYVKIERLLKIGDLTQLGEIFDITESWKFNGRTFNYCGKSKTEGI